MIKLINTIGRWQIFKQGQQVGWIDGTQVDLGDILRWVQHMEDRPFSARWCHGEWIDDKERFYTFKDGTMDTRCKDCRLQDCDITNVKTFFPLMQLYDIPYVPEEWTSLVDRLYNSENPEKMVFGKYLSKMKLFGWRSYRWSDSLYFCCIGKGEIPQDLIDYIKGGWHFEDYRNK